MRPRVERKIVDLSNIEQQVADDNSKPSNSDKPVLLGILAVVFVILVGGYLFSSKSSPPASISLKPYDGPPRTTDATPTKNPDVQKVSFSIFTKTGTPPSEVVMEIHKSWSPNGAKQFLTLVQNRFFKDAKFFRVVPKFMAQFGIAADPAVQEKFRVNIPDDPIKPELHNTRGVITFAQTSAPNTRSTQLFINFGDNSFLDAQHFTPIGKVVSGMDVVDAINDEYREQPDQGKIQSEGNKYLDQEFPRLSYIVQANMVYD
mmetsp:Transcript_789/g.1514  ORF Transcript_789/g.1514 Transcript_789/m.1514 type:complete len:260 (+) Transcript_789:46-825(+)|eukprot:CAMPEP_0175141274 /NCGR_PEP_ID=MMETSP0087-20121206/12015_1 /TAXON_ID=136419 /ORGANISM="Unknown Unknown, Strain D1" /LENGTH=259 /DNA_ID=CAMNT_0016424673 /DNA_START=43 /DNA_END=822 /DNA_ORIENTATION=-